MKRNYAQAVEYLSAPLGSFWKWDDHGSIVVWSNGSTLAFREELTIMLERLAPRGLPSFDSVLLLSAAMRAYWIDDCTRLYEKLSQEPAPKAELSDVAKSKQSQADVQRLFERLKVIHELPDHLIRTMDSKAELAAIVFEAAPRTVDAEVAKTVIDLLAKRLNHSLPKLSARLSTRVHTTRSLIHDLQPLSRGLEGISKESLELRRRTGLDTVPEPVNEDFAIEQATVRGLLNELTNDTELAGLSRLARNLAAVIQLPRSIADSDELPAGGLSDITNRGSLDRLLLSELAHDDLTLATRVALNEALYLRREQPPSFPPKRRYVLVDSGLRMWGVPRVFAAAVMLSLASTGEKKTCTSAYRASGSQITAIDLSSREGLIEHLEALETEVHPGRAIAEFIHRATESQDPGHLVLVTTQIVMDDPEFQQNLGEIPGLSVYIAAVNREGQFDLWSIGPHGRKCRSSLCIDLDAILPSRRNDVPRLIDSPSDSSLPAVLRTALFPIRLPYSFASGLQREVVWSVPLRTIRALMPATLILSANSNAVLDTSDSLPPSPEYGVMVLTRERNLLFFDDSQRGAVQLASGVPFGKCLHAWPSDDDLTMYSLIFREVENALFILKAPLRGEPVEITRLPSRHLEEKASASSLLGATAHGSIVFVVFQGFIEAFEIATSELVGSATTGQTSTWKTGRYLTGALGTHRMLWYAFSFDGLTIQIQRIPLGRYNKTDSLLVLFGRRGFDGPFAIDSQANFVDLLEQTSQAPFSGQIHWSKLQVLEIDPAGRRVLVEFNRSKTCVKDLEINETLFQVQPVKSLAALDVRSLKSVQGPMRRLTRVQVTNGELTLVSKGKAYWQFVVQGNRLKLIQTKPAPPDQFCLSRDFQPTKLSTMGHSLLLAQWADGSRVWIDSRGLLHLQSSDPLIPEVTFVLAPEDVAVWTNNGRVSGSRYYFDDDCPRISPQEVIAMILIPFVARLL